VNDSGSTPLGLLYDVHGNLPALEAVLDDAAGAGVDRFLLGGDYALFGPWPAATVERLRGLRNACWIRGNGERWTATPADAPEPVQEAIAACRDALGPETTRDLASLPEEATIDGLRFCHGSPVSDVRSFMPDPSDDEEELLAGVGEPVLVFGHTHLPFRRRSRSGDVELVNPGSVGMPFDGDTRAAWAVIHPDGRVDHRRVGYDHERSAAASRERNPGFGDTIALRIEAATLAV
jgi:diadenosine tetraphosphatase ApaH/serine/threonine PP2A family protein phosphatase